MFYIIIKVFVHAFIYMYIKFNTKLTIGEKK